MFQVNKLIDIMVGYVENDFIMDSTTKMEIKAMIKAGILSKMLRQKRKQ